MPLIVSWAYRKGLQAPMEGKIRPYVESDLPVIKRWIERQKAAGERTFWMNWKWIERDRDTRRLHVYELPGEPGPVAYMLGTLHCEHSLLEVESRYRGRGIGRFFAEWAIGQAMSISNPLLVVDASWDSLAFWSELGFEPADPKVFGRKDSLMLRKLRIPRALPPALARHHLTVEFFSGDYRARDLISTHDVMAVQTAGPVLAFDSVAAEFDPRYFGRGERLFFQISAQGKALVPPLRCDSAEARNLGVNETEPGYSFDRIRIDLRHQPRLERALM
ncbi:hypothetical protein [Achromobacter sp. 2789STDY5608633]|uniref:hypothetical protein n=1 Tax=Achromobacter sp. 2789STDY5608633 TaxID=1806501 RepID=UPI0012E23906|nr:hypothetical protein [Achromobacter sp. 2789STDY5608633]